VLPWIFAIAKHVRVDTYRKQHRIRQHEIATESLPEGPPTEETSRSETPAFDSLIAGLPESQREVLTMLKVNGLSLDEVARATSSTVGAVKQKASRAYTKLRASLTRSGSWRTGGEEATRAR
jgi:RNA polymerase sigma-70 factor, ECF subfamily